MAEIINFEKYCKLKINELDRKSKKQFKLHFLTKLLKRKVIKPSDIPQSLIKELFDEGA